MPVLEALWRDSRPHRLPIGRDDTAQAVATSVRDHLPQKYQVLESVPPGDIHRPPTGGKCLATSAAFQTRTAAS